MRVTSIGILVALMLVSMTGIGVRAQENTNPPTQTNPPQSQPPISLASGDQSFDPNQPIKPGFQLSITVTSAGGNPEPDYSGPFLVDATGSIQMKDVGLVQIRKLTPAQVQILLESKLKETGIKDPKAVVTILAVPKPTVFLSGAVNQPGATDVNEDTTLADALTIIGYTTEADLSRVRVTRTDDKEVRTTTEYNFLRWLKPPLGELPDQAQNPVLLDRDRIFVPITVLPPIGYITVGGAIYNTGNTTTSNAAGGTQIPVRSSGPPMLLHEVLSLAKVNLPTPGTSQTSTGQTTGTQTKIADRHQIVVRRVGVDRPFIVDYDRVEAGDPTQDIEMHADDIVYVQSLGPNQYINMNGAFIRPGRITYADKITLTQAISDVGGIALAAKDFDARIYRHIDGNADPTRTQIIAFNYKKIRLQQQPDILLEPGDTVEVPLYFSPQPPLSTLSLISTISGLVFLAQSIFGPNGVFSRGF